MLLVGNRKGIRLVKKNFFAGIGLTQSTIQQNMPVKQKP